MSSSAAFLALLDVKTGNEMHFRVLWHLDAGDQDITQYYVSGGSFAQEKERPPSRLTAGDTTLIMDNSSGAFSEASLSSFLYGVNYHNRKISLEIGLRLNDGTIEYYKVATMIVADVTYASDTNQITIHMYDAIQSLLTSDLNQTPATQSTPVYTGGGNGTITSIATMPFVTKTETWTLTCTTPGGSGVAVFSVVGSVSGNIGNATDGTEFANRTTGGIRFTINAGTINWSGADTIVFTTAQMMEWTLINPVKILWSILTGYNWDSNTADPWSARSALLDHTQSDSNVDLDYLSFATAVTAFAAEWTITGFIPWDVKLSDEVEGINLLMLGSLPVDALGRLSLNLFIPQLNPAIPREFSDTKKNSTFNYIRDTRDVINSVTMNYRKTTDFPWSDDDQVATLDGVYVANNAASQTALKKTYSFPDALNTRWYNAAAAHVSYCVQRIIDKYGIVPKRFTVTTGIDGIESRIGDIIAMTDTKLALNLYPVEITKREIDTDQLPVQVILTADDVRTTGFTWAFIGSSNNEGDGISPQAATWDTATDANKLFCYIGQTGGGAGTPLYYLF